MATGNKVTLLRVALVVFGIVFIVGVYPLTILWPSGWAWHMGGPSMYLQMILGIYATLGVFLVIAARNPLSNLSLIWFTVWSSLAAPVPLFPIHLSCRPCWMSITALHRGLPGR